MAIVKAMVDTGQKLDFITVDGSEGGTGAAPTEFSDNIGSPLRDALVFVDNALVGAGLRDTVKIGASGKIISSYDILRICALGADWVNMARAVYVLTRMHSGKRLWFWPLSYRDHDAGSEALPGPRHTVSGQEGS